MRLVEQTGEHRGVLALLLHVTVAQALGQAADRFQPRGEVLAQGIFQVSAKGGAKPDQRRALRPCVGDRLHYFLARVADPGLEHRPHDLVA